MKRSNFRLAFGLIGLLSIAPISAWATQGGEGNHTGCNGRGNANSPCEGTGGAGGNGGAGGTGGTGIGVGVGVGIGVGGQGGNATATGGRGGNARSNANARATGGNAEARGGNARASGGAGGTGGNATVTVQGGGGSGSEQRGGTYTVRSAPDAYAPPLAGGANPCVVGISLGGSIIGGGAAGGITWNDDDCEARVRAIILHNMGQATQDPRLTNASLELLCDQRATRRAMQRAGMPCAQDRPAEVAPTPAAVIPASVQPSAPVSRQVPDWCLTASPAERRRHAVCNG